MGIADFVEKRRKKTPPIIGNSGTPAYCLKKIGSRHLLLAGGGGAAKTGVKNEIETHLLTTSNAIPDLGIRAECVDKFDTDTFSTMNMDVACILDEKNAKYIIAAGHNEFCDIYMTRGYKLNAECDDQLAFDLTSVKRVRTDEHPNNSYQKCVRFDRNSRGKIFATGGADGKIRIWDAPEILKQEKESVNCSPIVTIDAHKSDVDDIDFSFDSKSIISVGSDGSSFIWSTKTGQSLIDLPFPIEIARGFKMRSVRCTSLGAANGNSVFVTAYNSISRSSKDMSCYVALWAFNAERNVVRPVLVKLVAKGEAISSLAVSDCGDFTAVGTMSGGIVVLDTHDFKQLLFSPETHSIFVTGLEFLYQNAPKISEDESIGQVGPGPSSGYLTTVVSLSADQSVQLHRVPHPKPYPFTEFILVLSVLSLILSYIVSFFIN